MSTKAYTNYSTKKCSKKSSKNDQTDKGGLINYYTYVNNDNKKFINPNGMFNWPGRIIVLGSSGSGKTNLICNLLFTQGKNFYFDRLYIYAKLNDEPLYQLIVDKCKELEEKVREQTDQNYKIIQANENTLENLVKADELDKDYQNIIIIDDLANESEDYLEKCGLLSLWCIARKLNTTIILVCHDYTKSGGCNPKLRRNSTNLISFKLKTWREKQHIHRENASDIPFDHFNKIFNNAVKESGFLIIDSSKNVNKMFRKDLSRDYIQIEEEDNSE